MKLSGIGERAGRKASTALDWRGLYRLFVAAAMGLASVGSLWLWIPWLFNHRQAIVFGTAITDFYTYRRDALRALTQGWGAYYNSVPNDVNGNNIDSPLQGLLMFPFLPFAYPLSLLLWTLFLLCCLVATWWLLGPRRLWLLLFMVCLSPTIFDLRLGQVSLVVAAIVALAWWLSDRSHAFAAGLVLSLASLKPQLVLLLPLVLLVGGRKREFVGFVSGAVMLALVSVALIGSNGVQRMLANQQFTFTHTATTLLFGEDMVLRLWLPGLFGWLLVALAAIGTLYLAYHYRQKSAAHIFAIGLLGSLLVAPYIRIPDLVLWLPAALLMRRGVGLPAWLILFGLIFTFLPLLPDPVVPLVALLVLVYRSESARKTSDRSQSSLGPVAAALEAR